MLLCDDVSGSSWPNQTHCPCLHSAEEWRQCCPALQINITYSAREMWRARQWKSERHPRQFDWEMAVDQVKMAPKRELKLHQQYFGMNSTKKAAKKCKRFPLGAYRYFSGRRSSVYTASVSEPGLKPQQKGANTSKWAPWARCDDLNLLNMESFLYCVVKKQWQRTQSMD